MSDENSIVNFGDLTKPATVLIEKISDAVGGLFKPYQVKRIAKAEAEAQLIDAETQIQITDLHRRAMHRFVEEEAQKQSNIEDITKNSLPLLEDHSKPDELNDDWITNFFDKCRIISDKEMQQLWSSVLANEANQPGTYSKRTVNLLSDLDKSDAALFTKLCGFGWMIGNVCPLVYDSQNKIYNDLGINFNSLQHLDSLGLVNFNPISKFHRTGIPKNITIHYFGTPVILALPKDDENNFELGHVTLTNAGQQLAQICGATAVPGFHEFVVERWRTQKLIAEPAATEGAT